MKILHVVHNYYPSKGGTQVLFKEVSERLVKDFGCEVTVCTTDALYGPGKKFNEPVGVRREVVNGVAIVRFPYYRFHLPLFRRLLRWSVVLKIPIPGFFHRYIYGPWSPAMHQYIAAFTGDVICGSASNYLFMTYPLWHNASRPFVFMGAVHFKEDETINPIAPVELKAIKKSAFYIANTLFEKKRLVGYGVPSNKIEVVGCGVEVTDFKTGEATINFRRRYGLNDSKIVGFVGRHEPAKGILHLLEAMEILWDRGRDYLLIIAGSPSQFTDVIKQRVNANTRNAVKVIFISDFSEDEKSAIYNNLDVFVSTSTEESFGIVYLEAWACKKPVIGANIGAIRSVIDDGKDGFLADPHNSSDIADKIDTLCNNDPIRSQLGLNGFNKVVLNYTWNIIAKKYYDIYEKAIESK